MNSRRNEELDDGIITIPLHKLQTILPEIFHNKVVLVFTSDCSTTHAKQWIANFNGIQPSKLEYVDSLINAMFVVEVIDSLEGLTKEHIINKPYFEAVGRCATFNDYFSTIDSQAPSKFKYLVSMIIKKGSIEVFKCLDFILTPIERIVSRDIALGTFHYMITTVVGTTCKTFMTPTRCSLKKERQLVLTKST